MESQNAISTGKAAKLLDVTPPTIRAWVAAGLLRAVKSPTGRLKIPMEEIIRVQAEGRESK